MSDAAHHFIDAFAALPDSERQAALLELARISEGEAGDITEEELTFVGDQLFAIYDAEEAKDANSNAL